MAVFTIRGPAKKKTDFAPPRHGGVRWRTAAGAATMAVAVALVMSTGVADWLQQYIGLAAWVQPVLLLSLCLLALIGPLLSRLPVWG